MADPRYYKDFFVEACLPNHQGYSVVNKFGANFDVGTSFEDVWDVGGNYVPPTEARLHDIASDNANDAGTILSSGTADSGSITTLTDASATFVTDTVAAGDVVVNDTRGTYGFIESLTETTLTVWKMHKGPSDLAGTPNTTGDAYRVVNSPTAAGLVQIFGLDADYKSQSEFVVMNGLSNVTTTKSYRILFRMVVLKAGSALVNQGTVTATAQTDATVTAQITPLFNQTLMAVYQVPDGHAALLTNLYAALARNSNSRCDIELQVLPYGEALQVKEFRTISETGTSMMDLSRTTPPIYGPRTFMKVRADANTAGTAVAAGFDLLLVKI